MNSRTGISSPEVKGGGQGRDCPHGQQGPALHATSGTSACHLAVPGGEQGGRRQILGGWGMAAPVPTCSPGNERPAGSKPMPCPPPAPPALPSPAHAGQAELSCPEPLLIPAGPGYPRVCCSVTSHPPDQTPIFPLEKCNYDKNQIPAVRKLNFSQNVY